MSVIANETDDRNKQEVMLPHRRYVLQHGSEWEIHESLILLFDIYRETDELVGITQLSNHSYGWRCNEPVIYRQGYTEKIEIKRVQIFY